MALFGDIGEPGGGKKGSLFSTAASGAGNIGTYIWGGWKGLGKLFSKKDEPTSSHVSRRITEFKNRCEYEWFYQKQKKYWHGRDPEAGKEWDKQGGPLLWPRGYPKTCQISRPCPTHLKDWKNALIANNLAIPTPEEIYDNITTDEKQFITADIPFPIGFVKTTSGHTKELSKKPSTKGFTLRSYIPIILVAGIVVTVVILKLKGK